jgi:hypothetical protein
VVLGTPLLAIVSDSVRRAAVMGAPYADTLRAEGGTGEWTWAFVSGTLPQGLTLTTAGRVAGVVESSGVFRFTARVTSGNRVMERQFRIDVSTPVLGAAAVFDRLLSGTAMHEDLLRYLDLQGNRNGRFDVGDARAWLTTNSSSAVAARADTARTMRSQADTARGSKRP